MKSDADFDVGALYDALDARRRARGLSWRQVTDEITSQSSGWVARLGDAAHPMSPATLTGMRAGRSLTANHALGMLLWLGRTPESFIPGCEANDADGALPQVGPDRILRWDSAALHTALDAQRRARGMTWQQVAREVRCSVNQVTGLPRLRYAPGVVPAMRMVRWLDCPAATFTVAAGG
jgi:uncharacterized protein YfiM (DUF2279 family)